MTLKAALNAIADTRYSITAKDTTTGEYTTIIVDYMERNARAFVDAISIRDEWKQRKTRVEWIRTNSALHAIEIRVDLLN